MVLTQAEAEKYLRDFARRLQDRRKQLSLNTTQLSERTGIARQTIESLESGSIEPRLLVVRRLARALETDPAALGFGAPAFRPDDG